MISEYNDSYPEIIIILSKRFKKIDSGISEINNLIVQVWVHINNDPVCIIFIYDVYVYDTQIQQHHTRYTG